MSCCSSLEGGGGGGQRGKEGRLVHTGQERPWNTRHAAVTPEDTVRPPRNVRGEYASHVEAKCALKSRVQFEAK